MEKTKKKILNGTLIAGAVMTTAGLSASDEVLFNYDQLGSGAEVRTALINERIFDDAGVYKLELKCGDANDDQAEGKGSEGKCGEAACGGKEDSTEKDEDAESDSGSDDDSKSLEAKCGEGKCGR